MIKRESSYRADAIGDNGKSFGLMQIQKRWHLERIKELGVTDLLDPKQNITVGVNILAELIDKCDGDDVYWVLMAYNGGVAYANRLTNNGTISEYAQYITERAWELEREFYGDTY